MATDVPVPPGLSARLAALFPDERVVAARLLGPDAASATDTSKGVGYGRPLKLELEGSAGRRALVLHVANADDFGHDRRADRAAAQLLAWDTFPLIPGHTRALDVGAVLADGALASLATAGEFYLLTSWADGDVYAEDLRRLAVRPATALDLARCDALLEWTAKLHQLPGTHPQAYTRALRDLVGSGEGIAGLVDGFPAEVPGAPKTRLDALERQALRWRQRLGAQLGRLRRTHGDLHPFNIVFADGATAPQLLDTSRGSEGDPADDVACLGLNYLFFGLANPVGWAEGLGRLWDRWWSGALARDSRLAEVVAPWLAWRSLVLANPRWYPNVSEAERDAVLSLAELALGSRRFDPAWGHDCLRGALPAAPSRGVVVWLTGLPSSGKSTLARDTASLLGDRAVVLDGDEVRASLVPAPGYDEPGRAAFYESLARLAATLAKQGKIVLVPATAHRRAFRDQARNLAPDFFEVFVDTPAALCRRRDAKGLYAAAPGGLPGLEVSYEPPLEPDLVVTSEDAHPARVLAARLSSSTS